MNSKNKENVDLVVPELTDQMWTKQLFLSDLTNDQNGKYSSTTSLYRGDIEMVTTWDAVLDGFINQIYRTPNDEQETMIPLSVSDLCRQYVVVGNRGNGTEFVKWIPNQNKIGFIREPLKETNRSGTLIANTTAVKGVFQRIADQFDHLFKRKAFVHWYKGEGIDEMELTESNAAVKELITEMKDAESAVFVENDSDSSDSNDVEK